MNSKKLDKIIFPVLLVIYTGVMLYLFLMQCFQVPDFVSDMPDYVNHVAGIQGNYEFPYPLMFVLARILAVFLGAPAAVAVVTALLNGAAVMVTKHYMECRLRDQAVCSIAEGGTSAEGADGRGTELTATFLTFALFLLGNLYSPKNTAFFGFDYAYRCMGIYTPNPIWNATYLAARPFAVICFFEACRVLSLLGVRYQQGNTVAKISEAKAFPWRESLPFAVSLFLTTLTKPSYTMVVMPAMAVIMLIQLIRSRGRDFFDLFYLCATMLPTVFVLLYQFGGVFEGTNAMGEETGIGFAFAGVWSNYSSNIPLSIVMGMALPIGVLLLNGKELKTNRYYCFAWLNYLVATVMFLCLYEKGFRMLHANFSWGYMYGMFVVFLMTLLLMIKNTIGWRRSWKVVFVLAEWAVFLYHLVCGVNFLLYALQGKELAGF